MEYNESQRLQWKLFEVECGIRKLKEAGYNKEVTSTLEILASILEDVLIDITTVEY